MKVFSLLVPAIFLLGVSCERHEFDGPNGTKQLHEHGSHGAPHGEEHGAAGKDAHGADDGHGHGAAEKHEEKEKPAH